MLNIIIINVCFIRGELVRLKDIENIYKKRKHDKQTRIDSIKVIIN